MLLRCCEGGVLGLEKSTRLDGKTLSGGILSSLTKLGGMTTTFPSVVQTWKGLS